jgi:hypothetical protein
MNEEQLKEEMDKALNESFNVELLIDVVFNMISIAFKKGIELGMKINKEKKDE